MKYYLLDSYGKVVRAFSSWSEANKFRITRNRPDWRLYDIHRCIYNINHHVEND